MTAVRWKAAKVEEERNRSRLMWIANNWNSVESNHLAILLNFPAFPIGCRNRERALPAGVVL
jgi:hypothetical protein